MKMKKYMPLFLSLLLLFGILGCSAEKTSEPETTEGEMIPILGVEIRNENEASFYALTKSTSYIWDAEYDENGEMISSTVAEGSFCLDLDHICTFTREQAGECISLKFSGSVKEYRVYSAKISDFGDKDKSEIIDEKYLVSTNNSKIFFPEDGEYYYVVDVEYQQGKISYGFVLE